MCWTEFGTHATVSREHLGAQPCPRHAAPCWHRAAALAPWHVPGLGCAWPLLDGVLWDQAPCCGDSVPASLSPSAPCGCPPACWCAQSPGSTWAGWWTTTWWDHQHVLNYHENLWFWLQIVDLKATQKLYRGDVITNTADIHANGVQWIAAQSSKQSSEPPPLTTSI